MRQHGLRSQRTTGQEWPDLAPRIATAAIPVSAVLSSTGSFSRPTLRRWPPVQSLPAGWWSLPGDWWATSGPYAVRSGTPTHRQPRVSQVRQSLQKSHTQLGLPPTPTMSSPSASWPRLNAPAGASPWKPQGHPRPGPAPQAPAGHAALLGVRPAWPLHRLQGETSRRVGRAGGPGLHLAGVLGLRTCGPEQSYGSGDVSMPVVRLRWACRLERSPQHRPARCGGLGCRQSAERGQASGRLSCKLSRSLGLEPLTTRSPRR